MVFGGFERKRKVKQVLEVCFKVRTAYSTKKIEGNTWIYQVFDMLTAQSQKLQMKLGQPLQCYKTDFDSILLRIAILTTQH